jgi:hypothetical protein
MEKMDEHPVLGVVVEEAEKINEIKAREKKRFQNWIDCHVHLDRSRLRFCADEKKLYGIVHLTWEELEEVGNKYLKKTSAKCRVLLKRYRPVKCCGGESGEEPDEVVLLEFTRLFS